MFVYLASGFLLAAVSVPLILAAVTLTYMHGLRIYAYSYGVPAIWGGGAAIAIVSAFRFMNSL